METCIRMFIAFITVPMFCCFHAIQLSINREMDKYVVLDSTIEYYIAMKMNEQPLHTTLTKAARLKRTHWILFHSYKVQKQVALIYCVSGSLRRGWVVMIRRGKRGFLKCGCSSTFSWPEWWLRGCALFVKLHQGVHSWFVYFTTWVLYFNKKFVKLKRSNWGMGNITER